jgi:hypothetical protein
MKRVVRLKHETARSDVDAILNRGAVGQRNTASYSTNCPRHAPRRRTSLTFQARSTDFPSQCKFFPAPIGENRDVLPTSKDDQIFAQIVIRSSRFMAGS